MCRSDSSCSFFGPEKLADRGNVFKKVYDVVENLINSGARKFYMLGKGDFRDVCYEVLESLRLKYDEIRVIACLYGDEWVCMREKLDEYAQTANIIFGEELKIRAYDDIMIMQKTASTGNKAEVVMNNSVIRDSDNCVFYLDDYRCRNYSKECTAERCDKHALLLAYRYATRKGKNIINICEENPC